MADPKPKRESLSKTPSWIMLGFVIGAVVMSAVQNQWEKREQAKAAVASTQVEEKPAPPPEPRATPANLPLMEMEAVFDRWGDAAVWTHDITQVAFWNPVTNSYTEYVEVLRNGEDLYFRSLPKLTRPLIDEAVEPNAPVRLTETEEAHAKRPGRWIFGSKP